MIAEADRDDYCKKSVELAKKVKIIIAKKKEEKDKSQDDIDELRITVRLPLDYTEDIPKQNNRIFHFS